MTETPCSVLTRRLVFGWLICSALMFATSCVCFVLGRFWEGVVTIFVSGGLSTIADAALSNLALEERLYSTKKTDDSWPQAGPPT